MTNILYNNILSDMETGYKVFRRSVIKDIPLHSRRFDFEPEFTAKILKRRIRIYEVPIAFNPRDYSEGKKIKMKDAFEAVWALLKYRFVDQLTLGCISCTFNCRLVRPLYTFTSKLNRISIRSGILSAHSAWRKATPS